MGFLILIAGAFLLLVAVAGILFLALAAAGAGFWWHRSRKAEQKTTVAPSATAARPSGNEGSQDSRSGR